MSPSSTVPHGARSGIPLPSSPLVGRARELASLAELLGDPEIRLITLTGPPGVGKTRLAAAAAVASAEHFPDGVVFVDLTLLRDPDLVGAEVTAALGGDPGSARADPLPRLVTGQRLLLLLDNFEHLLAAAEDLGELLANHPRVSALVTSRERLRLRGERELAVSPLALPGPAELSDPARLAAIPAVALLVQHARSFDPGFAVTDGNRAELAEICRRLDGLPLALELAAARLRLSSPAELVFRLRHRVDPLASDARDVPDRHRTLSAALAWSHDLLGPEERAMFRRLSVFVGGWTLAAAEAVAGVDDPEATTASLADKSLIRRLGGGAVTRFTMLESLREFAAEQLELTGETETTRARHAEYFTGLAGRIETRVGTADERAAIEEVGLEVGNLRAALGVHLGSGRAAAALPVAAALGWYSYTRGQLGDGYAILDSALAAVAGTIGVDDEPLASAQLMLGAIALARGDVERAEHDIVRSLQLNERVGSLRLRAIGTAFLGHVARARGRAEDAVARHEEAGRLHERLGNVHGVAWSRYDLGLLARRRHDPERAAQLLRESLLAFRDLRYEWAIGCSAWALATVELSRRRIAPAAGLLQEALEAFQETDDFRGVAQCLEAAAAVACDAGFPEPAAELLGAAAGMRDRLAAPVPHEERATRSGVEGHVRTALGTEDADRVERRGRELSTPAAIALAQRILAAPTDAEPATPAAPPTAAAAPESAAPGPLTPREHEVAQLVRHGLTNRQIGRQLGITEKTAEVHVHHIIRKLGASSRAEVAAWVAAGPRSAPT